MFAALALPAEPAVLGAVLAALALAVAFGPLLDETDRHRWWKGILVAAFPTGWYLATGYEQPLAEAWPDAPAWGAPLAVGGTSLALYALAGIAGLYFGRVLALGDEALVTLEAGSDLVDMPPRPPPPRDPKTLVRPAAGAVAAPVGAGSSAPTAPLAAAPPSPVPASPPPSPAPASPPPSGAGIGRPRPTPGDGERLGLLRVLRAGPEPQTEAAARAIAVGFAGTHDAECVAALLDLVGVSQPDSGVLAECYRALRIVVGQPLEPDELEALHADPERVVDWTWLKALSDGPDVDDPSPGG